jgi:hypothetical protein
MFTNRTSFHLLLGKSHRGLIRQVTPGVRVESVRSDFAEGGLWAGRVACVGCGARSQSATGTWKNESRAGVLFRSSTRETTIRLGEGCTKEDPVCK